MEYLHALSPAIIHRDLKSHNVLRAHNGSYKVCDFGLVKVKHTTAGTPAYMAPGTNALYHAAFPTKPTLLCLPHKWLSIVLFLVILLL